MKKIVFCFILSYLVTINLTACSKGKAAEEFVDKEWLFYNEVTAEHESLILRSDGTVSYSCQCGEPVGDFDLYEKYKYNAETEIITVSSRYGIEKSEIEVIDYNEYHLMVKMDGRIRDFVLGEMDTSANFFAFEGERYLEGYESRCTVVDIKEDHIVYGPINYDPEGIYEDGPFEEYALVENVPVFALTVRRYLSVQDDQEYEEYYEVEYTELTQKDIKFILDSGAGAAFLWFDDELRVEKIVFHGQLSVTADYVSITVPGELNDTITQKDLDLQVEEGLCDVAHLYEDGSIFYLMDREQYESMKGDLKLWYPRLPDEDFP